MAIKQPLQLLADFKHGLIDGHRSKGAISFAALRNDQPQWLVLSREAMLAHHATIPLRHRMIAVTTDADYAIAFNLEHQSTQRLAVPAIAFLHSG